jgi:osmoprotectant transport system ATP-binding protein
MLGLLVPDHGRVLFDGTPFTPATTRTLRHRIGYVLQDGGLFPHLTAYENVALLARYLRRPVEWIEARIGELASLAAFPADALARYPAQLSGGQRQRVGLIRALMLDPDVLLLDEPLGALDPMIRTSLQDDLKRAFQSVRKTVVLVTHDLGEAAFLTDELVLMNDGAIVQRGTVVDLIETPADAFVSRFLKAHRSPILVESSQGNR